MDPGFDSLVEKRMRLLALDGSVGAQAYIECKGLVVAAIEHAHAGRDEECAQAYVLAANLRSRISLLRDDAFFLSKTPLCQGEIPRTQKQPV